MVAVARIGVGVRGIYNVKSVSRTDKINCFILRIIIAFAWGLQGVLGDL